MTDRSEGAVFICGRPSAWARRVTRCPICKRRRRIISALVYGGYGSTMLCGGCGSCNQDLEGWRRLGKRESASNISKVKAEWPRARTVAAEREELSRGIEEGAWEP